MYLEKFKLSGKTAFITGGGQGIGLACAEALAEAGAKVIIGDRDVKTLRLQAGLGVAGIALGPYADQHDAFEPQLSVLDLGDVGKLGRQTGHAP